MRDIRGAVSYGLLALLFILIVIGGLGFFFYGIWNSSPSMEQAIEIAEQVIPEEMTGVSGEVDEGAPISVAGVYDVTVTVNGGKTYQTKATITEINEGRIKASGKYKSFPISVIGVPASKITSTSGTWSFTPNKFIFKGKAAIVFTKAGSDITLKGSGSGTYNVIFAKGSGSGTGVGKRVNE